MISLPGTDKLTPPRTTSFDPTVLVVLFSTHQTFTAKRRPVLLRHSQPQTIVFLVGVQDNDYKDYSSLFFFTIGEE